MNRSMQAIHPNNRQGFCPSSTHLSAHLIQKRGQIHNLRFAGCIFDNRSSICQSCCHHDVLRRTYGWEIHIDMRSMKTICFCFNIARSLSDLGPHGFQSLQVQIDWTTTNGTSTRHGNFGMTIPSQDRT